MQHTNNYSSIYESATPTLLPPTPPPLSPGGAAKRGNKRGHRKALVIFFVFLLLIGGTAAAMLALSHSGGFLSSMTTVFTVPGIFTPPGYDAPYDGDYDGDYDDYVEPDTTIERAPTAKGVELVLRAAKGDALSRQEIYQKCIPSVVSILTTADDGGGSGTGVVLTADGYIITNYHVIQGGSAVEVRLNNGRGYAGKLVGGDQTHDLAVLKIDVQGLTPAEFGSSDALLVGDLAFAIGDPLGEELRGTMTEGIISAINRDVRVEGDTMTLIQTSAALNPGNSGGALLNTYGQVVGITNMKMTSYFDTIEGLGFAIPSSGAKAVVEELISKGHVSGRPTLGFTGSSLSAADAAEMELVPGIYVSSVEPKSDAQAEGLRPGDVVTECQGRAVASVEEVNAIKSGAKLGDTLALRVYRAGEYLEMEIRLMERYELDR